MIKSIIAEKPQVANFVRKLENAAEMARQLDRLNIFITKTYKDALDQAKQLKSLNGPLSGLTVAVKDCYSTKNVLTTCGSRMLSSYVPPYTATVVERLLSNGALMVGKTNMDEFCMGASSTESSYGPVKNPWTLKLWREKPDLEAALDKDWHLAGGSSGGSAGAIAAGLADIALGSDTGGSTRNPAAFCGVVGFKPSYGLLSRHGLVPLTNSLDVPGLMAKTVDQIALALDATAGLDTKDATSIDKPSTSYSLPESPCLKNLVIGLPKEYFTQNLSKNVVKWWQQIAALLEKDAKCKLVTVSLPHTRYSIICYHVLGECEVASNMARYDGLEYGFRADEDKSLNKMFALSRYEAFNEIVRRRILAGNYFLLKKNYEDFYMKSLKVRRLIAEDFHRVFRGGENVDVLLTPVTLSEAPLFSEWRSGDEGYERERSDDFFTQPVNMAGIPAISLPVGHTQAGLPIGLQIIGDYKMDKKVLTVAKWIEKAVNFDGLKFGDILHNRVD